MGNLSCVWGLGRGITVCHTLCSHCACRPNGSHGTLVSLLCHPSSSSLPPFCLYKPTPRPSCLPASLTAPPLWVSSSGRAGDTMRKWLEVSQAARAAELASAAQ